MEENRTSETRGNGQLRKVILPVKKKSWKKLVGSIDIMCGPSKTVWKKFKTIQGQAVGKILQLETQSGVIYEDDTKARKFNEKLDKSGRNNLAPTPCTKEQLLISRHKFRKQDQVDNPYSMKKLTNAISTLKKAAADDDNIQTIKHCSYALLMIIL